MLEEQKGVLAVVVRSELKKYGRNANENVDKKKWIDFFQLEFPKWLDMLTVSYGATPQLQHKVWAALS